MNCGVKFAPGFVLMAGLVSACSGGGSSGPAPTPMVTLPATISIILTQQYTDTNVDLTAGEPISITATGSLDHSVDHMCASGSCVTTPAGEPASYCSSLTGFPAPELPCWSLIGKIGPNGSPFEVGTALQFTAATAGTLYLGINDNFLADNTGSWVAIITNPSN